MVVNYKIPLSYIILILGVGAFLPLVTFGVIDDPAYQTTYHKTVSVLLYLGAIVYFSVTPRNKKIIATEGGLSIPRILFPPYKDKWIEWKDVKEIYKRHNRRGNKFIVIRAVSSYAEISSALCFSDFEVSWSPKAFDELYEFITNAKYEQRLDKMDSMSSNMNNNKT